ncbi:MAG: DOMON-like domain-containing protein [Novosphingobium sp.]
MGTLPLAVHPDSPPRAVRSVEGAVLGLDHGWLRLRWKIDGASELIVPPFAGKGRADGLWQTTCFELFLRQPGADGYVEVNLSPSERWAAYHFDAYREGMRHRESPREADCTLRKGGGMAIFDAAIPLAALPPLPWELNLTAVIEEEGGQVSYWSLAHAPGKPDFHHPACFVATLPAPGTP